VAEWRSAGYPLDGAGGRNESFASVKQVAGWLASSRRLRVIDVRPRAEAAKDPIPRSANLPLEELAGKVNRLKGGRVLLVCNTGSRSRIAWALLVDAGMDPKQLFVMKGGRPAFERASSKRAAP
jgi:rhodanese-related sulfurtransferase